MKGEKEIPKMSDEKKLEKSESEMDDVAAVLENAVLLSRLMGGTVEAMLKPGTRVTADRVLACILLAAELSQKSEAEGGLRCGWEEALRNSVDDVVKVVKALESAGASLATIEEDAQKAADAEKAAADPSPSAS